MWYRWHILAQDKSRWNDKIIDLRVEILRYRFLNSNIEYFFGIHALLESADEANSI